jgi:putative Holliday junction resolvase
MVKLIGIDVGTKRIGVAKADSIVPVATPLLTIEADGTEIEQLGKLITDENAEIAVVGYPRNQSGDPTEQTEYSKQFAAKLESFAKVVFQDESLTSVLAEERLKASKKPYSKGDIDALAAAIILQDYLEVNYGA